MSFTLTQKQALFDEGVAAILKQGRLGFDFEVDSCAYADGKGNHCIAGHLFKNRGVLTELVAGWGDSLMAPEVQQAVTLCMPMNEFESAVFALGVKDPEDLDFLYRMQRMHDDSYIRGEGPEYLDNFRTSATKFAIDHGLNADVVN